MTRYLIIGNSAAGLSAARAIRTKDTRGKITLLSDEPYPYYSRLALTYLIAGKIQKETLFTGVKDLYRKLGLTSKLRTRVDRISPDTDEVVTSSGRRFVFDRLLLATGASPTAMPIPGSTLPGVCSLRTLRDAETIVRRVGVGRHAVILGGGLVGLQTAQALCYRGMRVTLVVSSDRILSRNLDRTGSDLIARAVGRSGITVLLNSQAVEFSRGRRTPLSVVLENGNPLQAHLVVLAKSVTPNIGLAAKSALSVHDGIVVNETLQTSREQVFAAGDVAEFQERVNFIWPNAIEQGRLAGLNMAGENASYQAGIGMNVTELFGIKIASIGKTEPEQGEEEICRLDAERAVYRKVILNEGRMTGALLVGDITDCGILHRLIRNRNHVAAYLTKLMTHSAGLANAFYAGSEPR